MRQRQLRRQQRSRSPRSGKLLTLALRRKATLWAPVVVCLGSMATR